jgi:hypothetical protein
MLKKATVIATLAIASMAASAQEEERARTYEELAPVAVKYAEALGCGGSGELEALDDKNVARFDVWGTGEKTPSTYVTVVNSDFGCLGGNGTTAGRLVVLQVDGWRTYVLPELSEPTADVIGAPRFFTSVYVKNGQLHATSVSYGPNDNQCCPSLREIYRVDLTHKELKPEGRGPERAYTWNFVKIGTY